MPDANGYPRYLMIVDDRRIWYTLNGAGRVYDAGMVPVKIGGFVLDGEEMIEREITDDERQQIVTIADKHSASK